MRKCRRLYPPLRDRSRVGRALSGQGGRSYARFSLPFVAIIGSLVCVGLSARDVIRVPSKSKGAGPLFQIHYGDAWGFMDRTGKTVIRPRFDDEGDFFEGRAKVLKNGIWGYVNEAGAVVIHYQFIHAGDFKQGLAPVQLGRKWGYIDLNGKLVVVPQFQAAGEFSNGLAQFEVWNTISCDLSASESASYTKDSAPLYAFRLHDARPLDFGECFSRDARFGFVDRSGSIVIPPTFLDASDFSEGLAAVRPESIQGKYGYIDKTGRTAIQPRFDQALPFSEGLAAVEMYVHAEQGKAPGTWGFIHQDGSFAIDPTFNTVKSFSEGLAEASTDGRSWGYIDNTGRFVIPAKFSSTMAFSEGLALVSLEENDEAYYIDKRGNKALTLDLTAMWSFSDGLTVAGFRGEQKYVDKTGRVVAPYERRAAQ
jgi:hypothetical protein